MKCSFLDCIHFWWLAGLSWWTLTSSATPLLPKKWNAHFLIMFNLWSTWLVNGLKTHLPPLSSQKNEMLIFGLCIQLLMIGRAGWWTETPSTTPLQPKKWNAHFWITFNFWWSARLLNGLKPHLPPLSSQRMKSSFLDYIQLLMIGRASWGNQTPSTTPFQPKKMKCFFLDYVPFWLSARLVDGLVPHLPALSSQKNEMLTFGLCSLRMTSQAGRWTQTPSITRLQPIKWNAHFLIMFNFWWSAGLVNGLKPHPPPLSSQKNEILIFYYVQLLMLARLVNGLKPHPPPLSSQNKWNACF